MYMYFGILYLYRSFWHFDLVNGEMIANDEKNIYAKCATSIDGIFPKKLQSPDCMCWRGDGGRTIEDRTEKERIFT